MLRKISYSVIKFLNYCLLVTRIKLISNMYDGFISILLHEYFKKTLRVYLRNEYLDVSKF